MLANKEQRFWHYFWFAFKKKKHKSNQESESEGGPEKWTLLMLTICLHDAYHADEISFPKFQITFLLLGDSASLHALQ